MIESSNDSKPLNIIDAPIGTILQARLPRCSHFDIARVMNYSENNDSVQIEWLTTNHNVWLINDPNSFRLKGKRLQSKSNIVEEEINLEKNIESSDDFQVKRSRIENSVNNNGEITIFSRNVSMNSMNLDTVNASNVFANKLPNNNIINSDHLRKYDIHDVTKDECHQVTEFSYHSLSKHRNILEPFIKEKCFGRLKPLSPLEIKSMQYIKQVTEVFTQPHTISKDYSLRSYQLEGFNWLLQQYHNGVNCILADEVIIVSI